MKKDYDSVPALPFEKELVRKDGTRLLVLVATVVLKLSPFRWITFVKDLRERDRLGSVEDDEPAHVEHEFEETVGTSGAMKRVMGQVAAVTPNDATVLILGETGTGKRIDSARNSSDEPAKASSVLSA